MGEHTGKSLLEHENKRTIVLNALRSHGMRHRAAREAGIGWGTFMAAEKNDPDWAEQVYEAEQEHTDAVEEELLARAVQGYSRTIYYQGEACGSERVVSDRLLELAIKAKRPAYRDKQSMDLNMTGGIVVIGKTEGEDDWNAQHRGE